MKEKLTKVILPFILISTVFLLAYSLFYWFVCIQLKLIDLDDIIFGYFVPISISTILIWFYFRKKLWLLNMTDKHREFTLFISWILLSLPVLTFQFYIVRETGKLTQLKSIDEIKNNKPTMYYSINNSFQHKNKTGIYIAKSSVDRGNEIGIGCYFACPLTNTADTISHPTIWIGTMFGEKFSDRAFDDKEKQAKLISKFIDSSITLYDKYEYKTTFLKRLSNSEERDDYLKAIQQTNLPLDNTSLIILKEETGNYKSRAGTSLWWTFFFIITSNVVWTLLTGFTKIKRVTKKNAL